ALIDPPRVAAAITSALTGPGVEPALARHLRPAIERELGRAEATDERLGGSVPAEVADRVEALLSAPVALPPDQVREAVNGEAIRQMLAAVVQEAVGRFMKSGGEGGGGLMGLVGRSAGKLRDAGKGLLGGLGDELERQVQRRVRDLLDSGMAPL